MNVNIGISEENRNHVANTLQKILTDEMVIYVKTRNAHWNVEGKDFYNKHKMFEAQYEEIAQLADDVAERIRTIGHFAIGSLKGFLDNTQLSEDNISRNKGNDYINALLNDHESLIISIRSQLNELDNKFKDASTTDFVTGLLETHEKMAWMLRSHLA